MKGTPKSIVSIILAAAMVFSSVSWNTLASAATETSGTSDVQTMSQSEQVETSETNSELSSEAESSEAADILEDSAPVEDTTVGVSETPTVESFAIKTQDVETVGDVAAEPNPTLILDDGDITLKASSSSLTYQQGTGAVTEYSGTVIIKQNSKTQLTNKITVNNTPASGTSLKDATAYVKLEDINTSGEFKIADDCKRDVVVTLANGSTNTLSSGLVKSGDETSGTLTIQAEDGATEETWGKLIATGGEYGAGIGGGNNTIGSNITVSGGTVIATGGEYGAGIGGGNNATGSHITINGGKVNVQGGKSGSGIGGGNGGSGSDIVISGGKVDVQGGKSGSGIGGGDRGSGSDIMVSEGDVTAIGGQYGAGIGGGNEAIGSNITISGGKVNATGGKYAVGIGGGNSGVDGSGHGSDIRISGGDVTATGGNYAVGIGGGYQANGSNLTFSGGKVNAIGGKYAVGIGGGFQGSGSYITISGGNVTATAGQDAGAGIGGGEEGDRAEKIYINGGSVNAFSESGKAIGCTPVVSATDARPVYLTQLTFNNGEPVANTAVDNIMSTYEGQTYEYGLKDVATDENGTFHGYFPKDTSTTAATLNGITEEFRPESEAVITIDGVVSDTLYTWYDITVNQPSEGGTVSVKGSVNDVRVGATVQLSNEPAVGYKFGKYVVKDASENPLEVSGDETFIMPASDVKVTAEFNLKDLHDINIESSEYGTVTPNPAQAREGETVTLTVQANAGYALTDGSLKANGQVVQKQNETTYTFVMPDEDVTVTAEYGPEELNISGGVMGTNYQYDPTNRVVTVITSTEMTLSNRESGKPAQTRIVVETSDANLALAGVNIDVSAKSAAGIELTSSCTGTVELTVIGENTIQGGAGKAGVQKAGSGTLKIQGMAAEGNVLMATGGEGGAGIGSEAGQNVENIAIENVGIIATGGEGGAGIGSGSNTMLSNGITITGSTVTATGGGMAAGIGGGYGASAENVKVTGSSIEISCSESGAGIGGGALGYLSSVYR